MRSKPLLIDDLGKVLREEELGVWDEKLITELQTYVYDDRGRANALQGCHDDRIMSLGITVQVYLANPHVELQSRKASYMTNK